MHWTTGQLYMWSHHEEYCLEACCIAIQISEGLGYSNFALHSVCRRCKPHESMAFVWTDSWGSKFYYVITSLANTILLVIMTWFMTPGLNSINKVDHHVSYINSWVIFWYCHPICDIFMTNGLAFNQQGRPAWLLYQPLSHFLIMSPYLWHLCHPIYDTLSCLNQQGKPAWLLYQPLSHFLILSPCLWHLCQPIYDTWSCLQSTR